MISEDEFDARGIGLLGGCFDGYELGADAIPGEAIGLHAGHVLQYSVVPQWR